MDEKAYIIESARTVSDKFFPELVAENHFSVVLTTAIMALEKLDSIKKSLFYGRHAKENMPWERLNQGRYKGDIDVNILHGILGMATEAGEMLECLEKAIKVGNLDLVNLEEEIYDCDWYRALLIRAIGSNPDEGRRRNIEKLKVRYPDKFTMEKATKRDLKAERKVLEGEQENT